MSAALESVMSKSMSKRQRREVLKTARDLASKGEHDSAERAFALVGISYVTMTRDEGN